MMYTKSEQKKHRQEWVTALRSGDYQQTTSVLRSQAGYCCLGVACDISGLGRWEDVNGNMYKFKMGSGLFSCVDLPIEVAEYYGIVSTCGDIHQEDSLIGMNDRGCSFTEIAKFIEDKPEEFLREVVE